MVSAALFNEHKLCFSFLICTSIMKHSARHSHPVDAIGSLSEEEWSIFLYSSTLASTEGVMPMPRLNSECRPRLRVR